MSLSRAFTTKRNKTPQISPPMPQRSHTIKHSFSTGTIRNKISAPVELISTTNMLSYNAPDLYPSSSSSVSGDEDGVPSLTHSSSTSSENSSAGSSPNSPEPNHLSCYFNSSSGRQSSSSNEDVPMIPQRALSHTKRSHEIISRQRSMSRMSGKKNSYSRSSHEMFSQPPVEIHTLPELHPFGNELAQVTELAEEYMQTGVQTGVIDEEEQFLLSRGLFKFDAQDYMNEIQGLFSSTFTPSQPPMRTLWI